MKNPKSNALLVAAMFATAAFAASAQTAASVASDTAESPAVAADDAAWAMSDRCLRETGTRIRSVERKPGSNPKREDRCVTSAIGRSHSGENLRRTGQRNVADALRMIDPAVR